MEWIATQGAWVSHLPSLDAQGGKVLSDYVANKGYRDFTQANKTLGNGTGFWVNRQ